MLEQYRDYLMSKSVSRHTAKGYAGDVSIFARWFEGTTGEIFAPESVTTIDVREYISYLTNVRRQKPATVARKVRALKNFFDWVAGTGKVEANPVVGVRLPRETKRLPKSLTGRELYRIRRVVYKADKPRDIVVFELLAGAGLRLSELCSLELDDVVRPNARARLQ